MKKNSDILASALAAFEKLCGSRVHKQLEPAKAITQAGWHHYSLLGDIERNDLNNMRCPNCHELIVKIDGYYNWECTKCDDKGLHIFNFKETACPWSRRIPCFAMEEQCNYCRVYRLTTDPKVGWVGNIQIARENWF